MATYNRKEKKRFRRFSLVMVFSCGAMTMMNAFQASYWQFFMTDVCLMSAAVAGISLTIGSSFELISCFLTGPMLERIRFPWGKYRSWLIVSPPFVTLCFLMMFTDYGLPEIAMACLMVFGYCMANFGINAGTTIRNLAISIGGKTPRDRAVLSTKKGQGSSVGTFVFGIIGFNSILFFNNGDPNAPMGYQAATLMFGALFFISHILLFRFFPKPNPKRTGEIDRSQPVSFKQVLNTLKASPSFAAILAADSIRYIARAVMLGIIVYYFEYVLNDIMASSFFFSASGIIAIIGSFMAEILVQKISKKALYIAGYITMVTCLGLMYLFGMETIAFIVLSCIWFFGLSFVNSTQIGMYADGIDFGVHMQKEDCRVWLMSLTTIPPRIGNFGKALVVGIGLAAIGYSAKVTPSPEVIEGIRILACIIPAAIMLVGLFVLFKWFTINDKMMLSIREDLAKLDLDNEFIDNAYSIEGETKNH